MTSMFDPEEILGATVSGRMATNRPPVPEGEYPAQIKDLKAKAVAQKNKETGIEEHVPIITFTFEIPNEDLQESLGTKDFPVINRRVYLNIIEETGALDPDNNLILGQIREACGQNNEDDKEWSPTSLLGASCIIRVEHNTGEDGRTWANITGFAEEE